MIDVVIQDVARAETYGESCGLRNSIVIQFKLYVVVLTKLNMSSTIMHITADENASPTHKLLMGVMSQRHSS